MTGLRYADVEYRDHEFMDLTSLTQDEFAEVLPSFEAAFQERMRTYRLDGQQRTGRGYVTYDNCPLPTPEDRLLFILVYLKTNPLQTVQGRTFGMPQNKANQWIHTLLPVIAATLAQQRFPGLFAWLGKGRYEQAQRRKRALEEHLSQPVHHHS
jgi:hypothetical protein